MMDRGQRFHVEAVRQWQVVKLSRDLLRAQFVLDALDRQVDVRGRRRNALSPRAEEYCTGYLFVPGESPPDELQLRVGQTSAIHSSPLRASSQARTSSIAFKYRSRIASTALP